MKQIEKNIIVTMVFFYFFCIVVLILISIVPQLISNSIYQEKLEFACHSINKKMTDYTFYNYNVKVECDKVVHDVKEICVSENKWGNCIKTAYIIKQEEQK